MTRATMTAEEFLDRWCPASWPVNGHLRHIARTELLALLKGAKIAAVARQREADAAACGRVAEEFGQRFVGSRDNRDAWAAVGAEACYHRIAGNLIGGPDASMVSDPDVGDAGVPFPEPSDTGGRS